MTVCGKCGRELRYYPDPDDDEMRNWTDVVDGSSYCPVDGMDHLIALKEDANERDSEG